jgi:hypothetical protein
MLTSIEKRYFLRIVLVAGGAFLFCLGAFSMLNRPLRMT